jgi:hypothetical protein
MREPSDITTTGAEDAAIESVVLQHLLDLHPSQPTLAELIREIAGPEAEFAERDAIERAVRDLAGVGLVNRSEQLVVPSRAALRFSQLLDR